MNTTNTNQSIYTHKALTYAEKYGIIEYTTTANTMIYYTSYPTYLKNKRYTIKTIVNLDTMQERKELLKRYNKIGVYNRN